MNLEEKYLKKISRGVYSIGIDFDSNEIDVISLECLYRMSSAIDHIIFSDETGVDQEIKYRAIRSQILKSIENKEFQSNE